MTVKPLGSRLKRKIIVTGHYGSGKTEFSVSLAMQMAAVENYENPAFRKLAIIDLDIINPYFRSREKRGILERSGISVYGSLFKHEITAELPAIGASLRAPLEDKNCRTIIDAGGNDSGALVLNQFTKYFTDDETTVLAVINAYRPDTKTLSGAIRHISAIESVTGLTISNTVNNSHLLRETTAESIISGNILCKQLYEATGRELLCNCYPEGIVQPAQLSALAEPLMPIGLYMRPAWLDY